MAWLFEHHVALPRPTGDGWQAEQREVEAARQAAAQALLEEGGVSKILDLARLVDSAGYIGKALHDGGLLAEDLDALIEAAARSSDARERGVAHGLVVCAFHERGRDWGEALLGQARAACWDNVALMTILQALPVDRWTWECVTEIGGEMVAAYWRRVPAFCTNESSDDITYAVRQLIDVGRARHALALVSHHDEERRVSSGVLLEVLEQAARQPVESSADRNDATMFQYYVTETLTELDSRDDVNRDALASLEWNYLRLLEHSRRPAKVLLSVMSEQPKFFIEMLSAVFDASAESGVDKPDLPDPEQARAVASQAFRLLELWNHIPGQSDDGTIDAKALEGWIKDARALAEAAGREDVADSRIGQMLSASPIGADGSWPAEPVREVLDLFRSKPMLDGFSTGKMNRRGVTTRMPGAGGDLERGEAATYRGWAKTVAFEHPHTAKALNTLAHHYELMAQREDEDAERLDWS